MKRTWVTVDDFIGFTGAEPYTQEDRDSITMVCDAVSGYLCRVRPDLSPPPVDQLPDGRVVSATPHGGMSREPEQATAHWAALQIMTRWWQKRGIQQLSGAEEFGPVPMYVDRDVEEALRIGRSARPVVA